MTFSAYLRTTLLLAALALFGSTAVAAAAPPVPCTQIICTKTLVAGPTAKRWISPQRFGPETTLNVEVRLAFPEGEPLPRTVSDGGCTGTYRAPGVRIRVEVCGRGRAPLRATYKSTLAGRPVQIAYEAEA